MATHTNLPENDVFYILKALNLTLAAVGQALDHPDVLPATKSSCAYYSLKETSAILGISPKTISNRICRSARNPFHLKPIKSNGRVQFLKSDVHGYVRNSHFEGGE